MPPSSAHKVAPKMGRAALKSEKRVPIRPGVQDRGLSFTDIRQRVVAFRRGRLASAVVLLGLTLAGP